MDWSRPTGVKRVSNKFHGTRSVQVVARTIGRKPASEDFDLRVARGGRISTEEGRAHRLTEPPLQPEYREHQLSPVPSVLSPVPERRSPARRAQPRSVE